MSKYFLLILLTLNLVVLSFFGAVLFGKWHFGRDREPEIIPTGASETAVIPPPDIPVLDPADSSAVLPPNLPVDSAPSPVLPVEEAPDGVPSEIPAAENPEEADSAPKETALFSFNTAPAPFLSLEEESFAAAAPVLEGIQEPSFKRRLPNHFRDIGVEGEQAEAIYRIQAEYHRHFHYLQRRIDRLVEERDRQIENLLTVEQKKRLAEKKKK